MPVTPELSVILPVFNEAESLPILWQELSAVLDANWTDVEVIFVDDASTDGSGEWLRDLVGNDARARYVRLARHAGLTAALDAGYRRARAPILVTLDSDLQSNPADIPTLVAALSGADAAVGSRVRRGDPLVKRWSSKIANGVRNAITREHVRDSACTLRAIRSECRSALLPYDGLHRFVPTLLRMAGHRVVEVPIVHRPRRFGASKFGIRRRAVRGFRDLLVIRWMQLRALRYAIDPDA
jgi:glycosyltransferase involved in cell wall biosynthesis